MTGRAPIKVVSAPVAKSGASETTLAIAPCVAKACACTSSGTRSFITVRAATTVSGDAEAHRDGEEHRRRHNRRHTGGVRQPGHAEMQGLCDERTERVDQREAGERRDQHDEPAPSRPGSAP